MERKRMNNKYVGRFLNIWLREPKMPFRGKTVFNSHIRKLVLSFHHFTYGKTTAQKG